MTLKYEINRGRKVIDADKVRQMLEMSNLGMTYPEIGEKLGLNHQTVGKYLRKEKKRKEFQQSKKLFTPHINSTMRKPLTQPFSEPARSGALDYQKIKSRGIGDKQ